MTPIVNEFTDLIEAHKYINTKKELIEILCERFPMVKDGRALYHTDFFAVVFCYNKGNSFSNVVLSLSKLEKYDHIPCFVVLVRKNNDNKIYLINTTFLEKISHSSLALRCDNIRGSFLGSNIRKEIKELGKNNKPSDFDDLWAYHQGFTWKENLERLVEKTNKIKPRKGKAVLDEESKGNLQSAPIRAAEFVNSNEYQILLNDLRDRCEQVKEAIIVASHIDNVNIRGRLIEALVTSDREVREALLCDLRNVEQLLPTYDTKNDLGDYVREFDNASTHTDIKTKVLYLDSNPKAYNVDKFLECMGKERTVFMFFFVGIDHTGVVNTILASVFHKPLLDTTILQHHWSGKSTRGVAQFSGKVINELLNEDPFRNVIDVEQSNAFLEMLYER